MSNARDFLIENGILWTYTGPGRNVVIPEGVTTVHYHAFAGCRHLTSVTIPDSVTSIDRAAFCDCTSLTSITIPDSVTSIGHAAFAGCSRLTGITIPDSVTNIGSIAFSRTAYDQKAENWKDGVLYIGNHLIDADSNIRFSDYTIRPGTKCIADSAFSSQSYLTSITIPDGVTSIGKEAFHGLQKLTNVTIPDSVTSIGDAAFYFCHSLTSVTIPDGVTSIGEWAFRDCSRLKSVTVPNSVTSIGNKAFYACNALEDVTWPSGLAKKLQDRMPKGDSLRTLHITDISNVSAKFRPLAVVSFAEDGRDCTDENGKKYLKYIKDNNNGYSKTAKEFREELAEFYGTSITDMTTRRNGNTYYKNLSLTQETRQQYQREYGYDGAEFLQ